ncbi:MAG: glycosyltransferase family 39 protein, partial [Planctomycetes bacterium]|nr:glycosyltransferase family 39 protein [Planctomycetota bacterium]
AVHAIKFERLWKHGEYIYDPREYHGPTLYYATLPFAWLSGAATFDDLSETTLRAVPLLFGVLLIAVTALVRDGLGRGGSIWAALLTAISPAFVYYSRYYIQEMLLVCFSFGLIACAWRFHRSRRIGWALAAGAFLGLTHATKETCLVAWGCMAIAAVAVRLLPRPHAPKPLRWPWKSVAAGLAVGVLVSILFFTAFFTNLRGPIDSIRTYVTYFDRAGNHGLHDHPWSFYWHRLLWWRYPPRGGRRVRDHPTCRKGASGIDRRR